MRAEQTRVAGEEKWRSRVIMNKHDASAVIDHGDAAIPTRDIFGNFAQDARRDSVLHEVDERHADTPRQMSGVFRLLGISTLHRSAVCQLVTAFGLLILFPGHDPVLRQPAIQRLASDSELAGCPRLVATAAPEDSKDSLAFGSGDHVVELETA